MAIDRTLGIRSCTEVRHHGETCPIDAALRRRRIGRRRARRAVCQGFDLRSLFTPSRPPAPSRRRSSPRPPAAPEWSGESGASGHPLMTADAIRAAAAQFPQLPRRPVAAGASAAACRARSSTRTPRASRPTCGSWTCWTRSPSSPSRSGTISTSWSATRASRTAARSWRSIARLRRGGESLWRRPLRHRGDLGRRIELRHAWSATAR